METSELGILWKKTRKQLPGHYWPNLHSTFDQTLRRKTCSRGRRMHSYYPQETYSLADSKQFHFTLCKKWDQKMSPSKPSLSQFSSSVMYDSLRHHGLQHIRPPCPLLSPGGCPSSSPLNQRGYSVMLFHPLLLSSPFAFDLSQHQGLFQWVDCSHQVS